MLQQKFRFADENWKAILINIRRETFKWTAQVFLHEENDFWHAPKTNDDIDAGVIDERFHCQQGTHASKKHC